MSKQGARSLILWSYLSGKDPSVLAPYIYPIWTAGASYLPSTWSPNVVTLSVGCGGIAGRSTVRTAAALKTS